ncbi:hypothetical protein ACN47E_001469 [Coniothyrium glycines]
MNSKRIFSWSKRQSSSETYYRTGGLLPIDADGAEFSNGLEVQVSPQAKRRRPTTLQIAPPDNKQFGFVSGTVQYNIAIVDVATQLQAAFKDLLRSPALSTTPPIEDLLPARPRSSSAPTSLVQPVELPGSLLLENHGFPHGTSSIIRTFVQPVSSSIPLTADSPDVDIDDRELYSNLPLSVPQTLVHTKSVPDFKVRHIVSTMRSVRSGNRLNVAAATKASSSDAHSRSMMQEVDRRRSRPDPVLDQTVRAFSNISHSTSSGNAWMSGTTQAIQSHVEGQPANSGWEKRRRYRDEVGVSTTPTPLTTRSKHIEDLKATISTQDNTISTLQAQFSSLRSSHDSYITSLSDTHAAEIAALKDYTRVLEEQLAQKPSLHHTSSNNRLFLLDTTDLPHTPIRESVPDTFECAVISASPSVQKTPEKQQHSPRRLRNSPEMENLKRKLSSTRRPETTNRNLLPELNQYKQNNVALQKQIESLMAKLNDSKKNERASRSALGEAERRCVEWEKKANEAEKRSQGIQPLQNTIDHLESRLEIANIARLDAEEQLFNLRVDQSPLETFLTRSQVPSQVDRSQSKEAQTAHLSISTVFSSTSPLGSEDSRETSTLSAFVTHIERLQDQVKQKDVQLLNLQNEKGDLQQRQDQLEREYKEVMLHSDIKSDLLRKTKQADAHVEQLRSAVIDREAIIEEKEKSIQAARRQLEQQKLLLQAEIRRHATMKVNLSADHDPLPELTTLARKEDVDKWISQLSQRLEKELPVEARASAADGIDAQMQNLRREIDFYVREIIYYKLDIRGYKSDIRKLKKITAQLNNFGGRHSDFDSDTSSLRPTITPSRSHFPTPELASCLEVLPTNAWATSVQPQTDAFTTVQPMDSSPKMDKSHEMIRKENILETEIAQTQETGVTPGLQNTYGTNHAFISSQSWSEGNKDTPASPSQLRFDELFTILDFDSSRVPGGSKTRRSLSESSVHFYADTTSACSSKIHRNSTSLSRREASVNRERSASASAMTDTIRYPLWSQRQHPDLSEDVTSLKKADNSTTQLPSADVLTRALRHSSDGASASEQIQLERGHLDSTIVPVSEASSAETSAVSSVLHPAADIYSRAETAEHHREEVGPQAMSSAPQRKLSAASNASLPFVIAMGSPHNPALMSPTISVSPSVSSITRHAPLRIVTPTSRTGIGGTMASSTPVTSPASPTTSFRPTPPPKPLASISTPPPSAGPTRKISLGSRAHENDLPRLPHTPSHSRSVSSSSIRTAIRLPKSRDKEDLHKKRKQSIGLPKPLQSPGLTLQASPMHGNVDDHDKSGMEYAFGIGEAI